MTKTDFENMNRVSVLYHLANNILRDPVEREACMWAANALVKVEEYAETQDSRSKIIPNRADVARQLRAILTPTDGCAVFTPGGKR